MNGYGNYGACIIQHLPNYFIPQCDNGAQATQATYQCTTHKKPVRKVL